MDDGSFVGRWERGRCGIIEWGTHIYRGMARTHETYD